MSNEKNLNENQLRELEKENHPNTIEYKRLQSEIERLKLSIIARMDKMQFTDNEKKEIIDIIEYHALLKDAAKTPLININEKSILEDVEEKVKQNSQAIANNMIKAVNEKMQEIINRKLNK